MSKIARGGFIFVTWIGDHPPPHVHVYRDRKLVVKWDYKNWTAMKGTANRRILKIIEDLMNEGELGDED